MNFKTQILKEKIKSQLFIILVLLVGFLYFSFSLSPSSYSNILNQIGAKNSGLIWGEPRIYRSDEFAVNTPIVQAVVNNNFQRINETSLFKEDFRSAFSFPIFDWGMFFKPYYWGFVFFKPSLGYSFYFSFLMVSFLIGYYLLAKTFGFNSFYGSIFSILLFFTGSSQFWWTSFAFHWAFLPWIVIIFLNIKNKYSKYFLLLYASSCLFISFFYPATISAFFVVSFFLILAFKKIRDSINRTDIIIFFTALLSGLTLAIIYLKDWILAMKATSMGMRNYPGGGVFFTNWLSQLFPYLTMKVDTYESYFDSRISNICESATVGSYLLICSLVFLDFKSMKINFLNRNQNQNNQTNQTIKSLIIIFIPIFLISCWQLLPFPGSVGKILFWNKALPVRLFFAEGLAFLFFSFYLFKEFQLVMTLRRLILFSLLIFIIPVSLKMKLFSSGWEQSKFDITFLIMIIILYMIQKFVSLQNSTLKKILMGIILIPNIIVFGRFNPLQSTKPIFEREETDVIKDWKNQAKNHPKKWLLIPHSGSVLNGLGFKALTHTLPAPELLFFKNYFGDLSDDEFMDIFNRWHYVIPDEGIDRPIRLNDIVVKVPTKVFK